MMYDSQYVILLFLLTAAGAEWFNKTESDATVSFFISTYNNDTVYTYPKARTFCRSIGGDIASVLSKEEEDIFVWRLHTHKNGYFIGLKVHYTAVDSTPGFSWDDGSPYTYSNWDASENFDKYLPCTAYVYNDMSKTWTWKTSHCESGKSFCICKRNFSVIESVTTATKENVQITAQDATTLPEFIEHSTSHVLRVTSVDSEETTSDLYGVNDNDILESVYDDGFMTGIGVGLGVGILIVIVIIVLFVIILKRKDRSIKGVEEVSAGTSPQYDDTLVRRTNVQSSNGEENHAYVEIENAQENTGNETTTQAYEALPNIINERTYQEYEQISNLQRHNVTCTDRY